MMRRSIPLLIVLMASLAGAAHAQRPTAQQRAVLDAVDGLAAEIALMADTLWDLSETALREHRSAEYLAMVLEREGFRVERRVAGMPTAFVATWGSGRPVIGVLAEYDALPGIGNATVPREQARADGVPSGQGCGHNLFGAGSVGAAIAMKRVMDARGIPGTVKLFGTPAEETLIGKTYMARDGVFDGLDGALEWHPDTETEVANTATQAMNNFTVEFFGRASHGAADPWNGRSALDAAELFTHGLNLMREHVKPTARIHYVLPNAGEAPNVVPAYANVWAYVRDTDRPAVEAHYAWILQIAEAAALATQTTHRVTLLTGVHEVLFNRPLQERMQRNLELAGAPAFDDEVQAFARALQTELGRPALGVATTVNPLGPVVEPMEGGSTDVAEVSYLAPTVGVTVATAGRDLPWHSWATAASHGLPGAAAASRVSAKALALTGIDMLTDPGLLRAAREAFARQTGGRAYNSPIPAGQVPPLPDEGH